MRRKDRFNSDSVTFQSSLDCDLLPGQLGEFRFMTFESVEFLVHGQRIVHAVLDAHPGAFGRSFVLGHVRGAAHRVRKRSRERLLLVLRQNLIQPNKKDNFALANV